ncbi:MAG: hypothetical protein KAH38_02680 [Candidatus Hydrogenedentes bacterium]|nr:hypothetical protein [Candidatus Hydrogenedentota bacterium]
MLKKSVTLLVALLLMSISSIAQPGEIPAPNSGGAPNVQSNEAAEGDVIFLKSGKVLRDITIGRENPLHIEVVFLPGEAPLQLPRTAIERIEYAADKLNGRSGGGLGDVRLLPHIIPGEKVSVELHSMLTAPISNEDLVLEEVDYLVVLREFVAKFSIIIDVDKALDEQPVEKRIFSCTIPAGKTVMSFLRTDLAKIAPEVRAVLRYDKIVLQKREDAAPVGDDIPPPPMQ